MYDAWDRFKELLTMCPDHGFVKWLLVQIFYNEFNYNTRILVDVAAGGALMNKSIDKTYDLFEDIAFSYYERSIEKSTQKKFQANMMLMFGPLNS